MSMKYNPMKMLLIAAAMVFSALTGVKADTIRVGIGAEPYPPFSSLDASGEWVGWEIDMIHAVCAEAKLSCVITPIPWEGIMPALEVKKIDMIMNALSITDERKKIIDFSDKYSDKPAVIVGSNSDDFSADEKGLTGKIVGVQISTNHEAYLRKHFGNSAAEIRTYQTQDEAQQDLVAGRIDAVMADIVSVSDFLKTDAGKSCCNIKGNVESDPQIMGAGQGVGVRKGDTELDRFAF